MFFFLIPIFCYPTFLIIFFFHTTVYSFFIIISSVVVLISFQISKLFEIEIFNFNSNSISKTLFIFAILMLGFAVYFFHLRTSIEPLGMWDAWAMWSPKTKYFVTQFLSGKKIELQLTKWPHPDYPLGFPLFASVLGILWKTWTPWTQIIASMYFYFLGFYLLIRIKASFWSSVFSLLIYCTFYKWMMLSSDLCADLPLSVYFGLIFYILFGSKEIYNLRFNTQGTVFGFLLGTISFWKNEGLILSAVLFFILIIRSFKIFTKDFYQKATFFAVGFIIALSFILFQKMNSASPFPEDFIRNESPISSLFQLIENLTKLDRWKMVMNEMIRFHLKTVFGFYIFAFIYCLCYGNKEVRLGIAVLTFIYFVYDLLFIITNVDLNWHLVTAYERIHLHLFLPFLICLSVASLEQKEDKNLIFIFKKLKIYVKHFLSLLKRSNKKQSDAKAF